MSCEMMETRDKRYDTQHYIIFLACCVVVASVVMLSVMTPKVFSQQLFVTETRNRTTHKLQPQKLPFNILCGCLMGKIVWKMSSC
jgi:hypothetical protein